MRKSLLKSRCDMIRVGGGLRCAVEGLADDGRGGTAVDCVESCLADDGRGGAAMVGVPPVKPRAARRYRQITVELYAYALIKSERRVSRVRGLRGPSRLWIGVVINGVTMESPISTDVSTQGQQ